MSQHEAESTSEKTVGSLTSLLLQHERSLAQILRREAAGLLRYESLSDLAQGVRLHALQVERHFEYRSDPEFMGWLRRVTRQHIADRHAYWSARKRYAGRLIRITTSDIDSSAAAAGVHPAGSWTSPSSFAERKEHFAIAARAVSILLPRDQEIVGLLARDQTIHEIAEALGITYDAAERARLRTLERFKKAFRLLAES